jgi:hypothetical protein
MSAYKNGTSAPESIPLAPGPTGRPALEQVTSPAEGASAEAHLPAWWFREVLELISEIRIELAVHRRLLSLTCPLEAPPVVPPK